MQRIQKLHPEFHPGAVNAERGTPLIGGIPRPAVEPVVGLEPTTGGLQIPSEAAPQIDALPRTALGRDKTRPHRATRRHSLTVVYILNSILAGGSL